MLDIDFSNVEVMISRIKKEYNNSAYCLSILNHQTEPPLKDDIKWIIAKLRFMFPSTYDFRAAKQYYDVYNHNRLETKYLALLLKEMFSEFTIAKNNAWKEEELKKYNCTTWEEYFKMCGWQKREHSNQYIKPTVYRDFTLPKVLEPTKRIVLHHNSKEISYRGKKNIQHEQYLKNKKAD